MSQTWTRMAICRMSDISQTAWLSRAMGLALPYGRAGECVDGSCWARWYCLGCGEPMRVSEYPPTVAHCVCEVCSGHKNRVPGGYWGPIDDVTGYQANAIRAMEGDS